MACSPWSLKSDNNSGLCVSWYSESLKSDSNSRVRISRTMLCTVGVQCLSLRFGYTVVLQQGIVWHLLRSGNLCILWNKSLAGMPGCLQFTPEWFNTLEYIMLYTLEQWGMSSRAMWQYWRAYWSIGRHTVVCLQFTTECVYTLGYYTTLYSGAMGCQCDIHCHVWIHCRVYSGRHARVSSQFISLLRSVFIV